MRGGGKYRTSEKGLTHRAGLASKGKARVYPQGTGAGNPPPMGWAGAGLGPILLQTAPVPPSAGMGHSLAKGEVAVEPLRKLGDPGTPRPATPGAP